jgi:hypothetical protein
MSKTIIGKTPSREDYQSLPAFIEAKKARRLETTPDSCRNILANSWKAKTSPRSCIKAMCLECLGFDRQAITDCTAYACPLWLKRPYQKGSKPSEASEIGSATASETQTPMPGATKNQ